MRPRAALQEVRLPGQPNRAGSHTRCSTAHPCTECTTGSLDANPYTCAPRRGANENINQQAQHCGRTVTVGACRGMAAWRCTLCDILAVTSLAGSLPVAIRLAGARHEMAQMANSQNSGGVPSSRLAGVEQQGTPAGCLVLSQSRS